MNKYKFSTERLASKSFDVIDAPTLEQAVKIYGILCMGENPTTTDLWVCVHDKKKYGPPKQIRINVRTTVEYTLEEYDPLTQKPSPETKARGLEMGTLVAHAWGKRQGDIVGTIVGFDADGDPLVRDEQGISSWLPRSLTKAEEVTK